MTRLGLLAVLIVATALPLTSQELRFEVASIRVNTDVVHTTVGFKDDPASLRVTALSLKSLIGIAYQVREVLGPDWLDDLRFDIAAKPPAGYESRHLPELMRNLLADRFKLVAHLEPRQVQGFALRVAPGGHRLKESTGERTYLTGRQGLIAGNRRPIRDLVGALPEMVGAPVIDETGLKANYDLKLEWTPQLSASTAGTPSNQPEVSIFTALREQMGLRLDRVPTTIQVAVVDSSERLPTEN